MHIESLTKDVQKMLVDIGEDVYALNPQVSNPRCQTPGVRHGENSSRAQMDVDAERRALRYSIEEYPPIDCEYEKSCIYHPYTEPEEAFEHLNKLIPCRENAFPFKKNKDFQKIAAERNI